MKLSLPKSWCRTLMVVAVVIGALDGGGTRAEDGKIGEVKRRGLGGGMALELMYLPPGEFMMGSTAAERAWATGIEGGATPGTGREKPEGDPRLTKIKEGLWMGRTEVSVGQFRRFVEESDYVSDAEKLGGETQCFDPAWDGYGLTKKEVVHPWKPMKGKSWRDPNFAGPLREDFPVVCVSWMMGGPSANG